MASVWFIEMQFKPAGPLTFRRLPSGLLHIMSYPFLPPTTMSGFLHRLGEIKNNGEWPGYGADWYEQKVKFTLTLPPQYRALGAFPGVNAWNIHKTRRHGPKVFDHINFSRLLRLDEDESRQEKKSYQLHHWDYLFCDTLTGWVAAQQKETLDELAGLKNYGGKVGKEGFLFISAIKEPREVSLRSGTYRPLGLVPASVRPRPAHGSLYSIYAHHWDPDFTWLNGDRGGVDGYTQVAAWWQVPELTGDYWEIEAGAGWPASVLDTFLVGDCERFWAGNSD